MLPTGQRSPWPGSRLPRHLGLALHRTDLLEPVDVTIVNRVPVTNIPRTLLDLGAVLPIEAVEVAAQSAVIANLVSIFDLVRVLERVGRRGRRRTAALRSAVRSSLPPKGIASHLELGLLRLIEQCPVPVPVLQYELCLSDGRVVRLDTVWPDMRVGIEADGRRWHSTREEFERDMARSRAITAAGWRHYRYGWADVHQRGEAVKAEITTILASILAA